MKPHISKALTLGLLLFSTGCVGLVPIPKFTSKPETGVNLHRTDTRWIAPGKTTREEIVQRLGAKYRRTPRSRAIAYSWEIPAGHALLAVAGMNFAGSWEFEMSRWRALFIDFDPHGVVTRASFQRLSQSKSLDDHLDRWAQR